MHPDTSGDYDVVVIGAGFGGIGMAIALLRAGRRDFVVLERADDLGGTWRDNRYPGCACDVPSHLYSYSFAPNPAWSRRYSGWREILAYLRVVATRHGVLPFLRFGHAVARLDFDAAAARWRVTLADGRMLRARVVVSAIGGFSRPRLPEIAGRDTCRGIALPSARWDPDVVLAGRRVAVIGTGASAIQLVPPLAAQAERVSVFQRTPPWIVPRRDRARPRWTQWLHAQVPALQRVARLAQYCQAEGRVLGLVILPAIRRVAEASARRQLRHQVTDPALRAQLAPAYPMGCKRVLISDDYYPALNRPSVELVTDPIARIAPDGVVTAAGREHRVDAIVYATGFDVTGPPTYAVHAPGGRELARDWADGGEAWLGVAAAGYPNWFVLSGPNTGLAHNSVVYMLESQIAWVLDALRLMDRAGAATLAVRPAAQAHANERLDRRLAGSVWTRCESWYRGRGGRVSVIWPDFTFRYRRLIRRADPREFELL